MASEVDIKVVLDSAGAVQSVKQLGQELDKVKDSAESSTPNTSFDAIALGAAAAAASVYTLTKAFNAVRQSLESAAVFQGVENSFNNLQNSIGQISTETLPQLAEATKGLVNNFDLMKSANQAVLLGVDDGSGKFDEMAAAAVRLGQATGRTAKEALDDLITGVGRASPLILDNLGITVKAEDAYLRWAEANNTTVTAMTEVEKKAAFQAAAIEQITTKSNQLADVQINAATAYTQLQTAMQNARAEFDSIIANNENLKTSLSELVNLIQSADFSVFISGLVDTAAIIIKAGVEVVKFTGQIKEFLKVISGLKILDVASEFETLNEGFANFSINLKNVANQGNLTAEQFKKLNSQYQELVKETLSNSNATEEHHEALSKIGKTLAEYSKTVSQVTKEQEKLTEETKEIPRITPTVNRSVQSYTEEWEKLKSTFEKLNNLQNNLPFFKEGIPIPTPEKSIAETIFSGLLGGEVDKGFSQQLGQNLANTIGDAVQLAIKGGSLRESLAGLGGSLGSALGSSGGPLGSIFGQAIGQVIAEDLAGIGKNTASSIKGIGTSINTIFPGIGSIIEKGLGSIFGGIDKDRELARTFSDAINKIIEKSEIDFDADNLLDTDNWRNTLQSLKIPDDVRSSYDGLATALAASFDMLGEESGYLLNQFQGILAANFQNIEGLNEMQIILTRAGASAEELNAALEDAFLSGDLAAEQFLQGVSSVNDLFTQGIPGAIGNTTLAFENFITKSLQSGAHAVDSLGDLAAEGAEKGISGLQELKADLLASGQDASKVQALFDAIAKAGISSMEALKNVTSIQSAEIVASLNDTTGYFAEASRGVEELHQRLDQLQNKEIQVKLKVSTEYDSTNSEKLLSNDLNFNNRSGIGIGG